jgi:hypothetical protein
MASSSSPRSRSIGDVDVDPTEEPDAEGDAEGSSARSRSSGSSDVLATSLEGIASFSIGSLCPEMRAAPVLMIQMEGRSRRAPVCGVSVIL